MKFINYAFHLIVMIVLLHSCIPAQDPVSDYPCREFGWKAVYKHDENGEQIKGSLDSLIAGIRSGYSVRVGWGWEKEIGDSIVRLEHMATPIFLTILQEKEVSVVIDAHPLLQSYIELGSQRFREGGHTWQCVLTTKGTFNAQVHHRATGELIRDWPQRQRMTWFLDYPCNNSSMNSPCIQVSMIKISGCLLCGSHHCLLVQSQPSVNTGLHSPAQ